METLSVLSQVDRYTHKNPIQFLDSSEKKVSQMWHVKNLVVSHTQWWHLRRSGIFTPTQRDNEGVPNQNQRRSPKQKLWPQIHLDYTRSWSIREGKPSPFSHNHFISSKKTIITHSSPYPPLSTQKPDSIFSGKYEIVPRRPFVPLDFCSRTKRQYCQKRKFLLHGTLKKRFFVVYVA
jgi:hypothetical protein